MEKASDILSQASGLLKTGQVDKYCNIHQGQRLFKIPNGKVICELCSDIEMASKKQEEGRQEWKAIKQEKINKAVKGLNFPSRLKKCTFGYFKHKDEKSHNAFRTCTEYANAYPRVGGLLLLGGVGTGKTHLAAAICHYLALKGHRCRFTTVNRLIRAIRSTWGINGEETEQEVINRYAKYNLLVVDEVGSQYGTDAERITVNEIINDRYENELPTIIIGNVSLSEAKELLGERVVDRLKENGRVVVFDWESYRGRK